MPPLILITACTRALEGYTWHAAVEAYLKAVAGAGGLPAILPALGDGPMLDAAIARADGLLVTGSRSNVHPAAYGEAETEAHPPYDPARDGTTLPLIRKAVAAGLPMLAICRGIQELNVAFGGSLDANVSRDTSIPGAPGRLPHGAPDSPDNDIRFGPSHDVAFEEESRLGEVVGAGSIRVNSLHGQGIARLAPGLAIEARAPDGTIEAVRVEGATAFAFGVQWHPEYWAASDPASRAIFAAFIQAARDRAAGRN